MAQPLDERELDSHVFSTGIELPDLDDVYTFHESTKTTPTSSVALNLRVDRYLRSERAAVEQAANRKNYDGLPRSELPAPSSIETPLGQILERRCSLRRFVAEPLALARLSSVLASLRVTRTAGLVFHPQRRVSLRPYPSGGALYPVEAYALALNVEGLAPGVYHYEAQAHALRRVRALPAREALAFALGDNDGISAAAPVCFLLTAAFQRSLVKYDRLGYRFALLEAGIVGHQLMLTAVGAGLGTLLWGSYLDDPINDLLGVDGVDESVVHALWVGEPPARGDAAP